MAGRPATAAQDQLRATMAPPSPRSLAVAAVVPLQAIPARPATAVGEPPPTAAVRATYAVGVRPRKQALHIETGDRGVSVWVRDTAMNSQQANHLAAAIVANLGDGEKHLAALYLNGRALVEDTPSHFIPLFPPNPSE